MPLVQGRRIQELRELGRRAELGKLGVQFRRDDHRAQEIGVHTRHHRARRRNVPIVCLFDAQDDGLGRGDLGHDELLHVAARRRGLQEPTAVIVGGREKAGRIDDAQIRAVAVLDPHYDLVGREGARTLEPHVLGLDVSLEVGQAELLLAVGRVQIAHGLLTRWVVLHLQCDRAARLRAAADVVELESHERFDQRRLAVRLPAYDDDCGRIDGQL